MPGGHPGDSFLIEASRLVRERFQIGHATLQIESGEDCALSAGC